MLVQALARYADTYLADALADRAFCELAVDYLVELDANGRFLGLTDRSIEGAKRSETMRVARSPVPRNSPTISYPLLACDALQYVLGVGEWTKAGETGKHRLRHEAFVEQINEAASIGDEGLLACQRFYADPEQVQRARGELAARTIRPGLMLALSYRPPDADDPGGPVIERSAVRAYWSRLYHRQFESRHQKAGTGMCLISGRHGPIAATHDKIKGAAGIGGQASGVSLMSFDKGSFRSYGWKQSANSPVSPERATAYVLALNDLLRTGEHRTCLNPNRLLKTRYDLGGVAMLYWSHSPSDDDFVTQVVEPDPEVVSLLILAPRTGREAATQLDFNDFYMVTVSGNGGRLVVHDLFVDTLECVRANISGWFQGLAISDVFHEGNTAEPPRLLQLVMAAVSPGTKLSATRAGRIGTTLLRRALHGTPLPRSILIRALKRARAAQGNDLLSPARNALIRLAVNDIIAAEKKGGQPMTEGLDPNRRDPGYVCGRLLAVYDSLQYQADSRVGHTVADRFYSLAMMRPSLALSRIELLSKSHLKKLRRDNRGAATRLQQRLQELMDLLVDFPTSLDTVEQGRFVLGYHHQKANDVRQAMETKLKKAAQSTKEGE